MQRRLFLRSAPIGLHMLALQMAAKAMSHTPSGEQPAVKPVWRSKPFMLGVASGMPSAQSVLLWTRLYPEPAIIGESASTAEQEAHFLQAAGMSQPTPCLVTYEVYADAALQRKVKQGDVLAYPERGWSVHAKVEGLEPHRPYWYRFQCGNATSPVGKTQTTPRPQDSVAQLRLALASCQHYERGWFAAHADMAQQSLDAVMFVGDYIYESVNVKNGVRQHTGGVPYNLANYRERHALYKLDPQLQACHAAHPWICTWDDHEVENDYAADQNQTYTEPARFLRRRAAAYQAYFENMPVSPYIEADGSQRIYQQWQWGQLADVWMLDCRQYRSPQPCRDPFRGGGRVVLNCEDAKAPSQTMLGAQQEAWLYQGLQQSKARWRIIGQNTQMSPTRVQTPLGTTFYSDGWEGYAAARQRLLQTVAQLDVRNVVVLGGDVHQNVAANLRVNGNDPASPIVASEFVGTSITSKGLGRTAAQRVKDSNPDIAYLRSDERGYALLHISPNQVQATFRTTSHPVQANATLQVQARFGVNHGAAGIVKLDD